MEKIQIDKDHWIEFKIDKEYITIYCCYSLSPEEILRLRVKVPRFFCRGDEVSVAYIKEFLVV